MEENFQIQLSAILGPDVNIQQQLNKIKGLSVNVDSINLSKTAASQLKKQLQNNNVSLNLDLGNTNNVAKDAAKAAKTAAKAVNTAINQAMSNTSGKTPFSELKINPIKVDIDDNGKIADIEKAMAAVREQFKQFGQVSFSNQFMDAESHLDSLIVKINKINGELKSSRSFKLALQGDSLVLDAKQSNRAIKGSEKYVQHLDPAKNTSNETGDAVNKEKQINAERLKYYAKIKNALREQYSLQSRLLSAGEKETEELQRQLKNVKERVRYNQKQIDKKGLRTDDMDFEVNTRQSQLENRYRILNNRIQDNDPYQKLLNRTQTAVSNGSVQRDMSGIETQYNRLQRLSAVTDSIKQKFQELNQLSKSLSSASGEELVATYQQWQSTLAACKNEMSAVQKEQKEMSDALRLQSRKDTLTKQIDAYIKQNSKLTKTLRADFLSLHEQIQSVTDGSQMSVMSNQFTQLKSRAKELGLEGRSFIDEIQNDIGKVTEWLGATTIVMGTLNQIRHMVTTVRELDDAVTDLRMVTGDTDKATQSLMKTYTKMGDRLSATTTDVAASASEWLRQGQNIADTNTLIQNSIILSKVGDLDAASSTKYMTSAMKGYQIAAEDTLSVVDKLSAVDMASATDVGGLAEGMSEVAANAQLAGVSIDQLLGYLATIGETTQEGMSSVGTALNAIFSRMGNIKLSRLKDYQNNEGEDLSNVETVLRQQGISLRDEAGEFRNFGEVLDETAANWQNYSSVSQRAIASAFAGTHHMDEFIILMRDYSKSMDYATVAANSNGEALQKYEAYQESITGKTERFQNAFQSLSSSLVNSDVIKFFVDLGTTGVNSITSIVDAFEKIPFLDGGITTLSGLSGALMGARGVGYVYTYISTNVYKAHENCCCIC